MIEPIYAFGVRMSRDGDPQDKGMAAIRDLRTQLGLDPENAESRAMHELRASQERVSKALSTLADTQDDRINFRINSLIKQEFERLCKARGSTLSREIKRFMVDAVRTQKLF